MIFKLIRFDFQLTTLATKNKGWVFEKLQILGCFSNSFNISDLELKII